MGANKVNCQSHASWMRCLCKPSLSDWGDLRKGERRCFPVGRVEAVSSPGADVRLVFGTGTALFGTQDCGNPARQERWIVQPNLTCGVQPGGWPRSAPPAEAARNQNQ